MRCKWEGGEPSKGEARLSVSARRRRGGIGRGTRGTHTSFGGAVAKLALVTPANIGALQSYPLKEISSRDLNGEEVKENNR